MSGIRDNDPLDPFPAVKCDLYRTPTITSPRSHDTEVGAFPDASYTFNHLVVVMSIYTFALVVVNVGQNPVVPLSVIISYPTSGICWSVIPYELAAFSPGPKGVAEVRSRKCDRCAREDA
jgi:hypothetical protein